jgi:hypothetical protein
LRQEAKHILMFLMLIVAISLAAFVLSGCFLLGPQVVIPTLAPNASPVVGIISSTLPATTLTVNEESPGAKTPTPKMTATQKVASATARLKPTMTKEAASATPTVTSMPPTATVSPEPPCPQQVDDRLLAAYNVVGGRSGLGCAKGLAIEEQWGYQQYEHDWMFWRGPKTTIYAGNADGTFATYVDSWNSSLPERACDYPAPSGLMQPKRGFGLEWCVNDELRAAIGFASAEEFPAQALVQEFDHGIISAQVGGSTRVFFYDGSWEDMGSRHCLGCAI